MFKILFGDIVIYGDIVKVFGVLVQFVGGVCGGNLILIIILCYCVMGVGGKLIGFFGVGGVEIKVVFLCYEGVVGFLIQLCFGMICCMMLMRVRQIDVMISF